MLEGSMADSYAPITMLNGSSAAEAGLTAEALVKRIDQTAVEVYDRILDFNGRLVPQGTHRFACYAAADGANSAASLTTSRLVVNFDRIAYHAPALPAVTPTNKTAATKAPDTLTPGLRHKRDREGSLADAGGTGEFKPAEAHPPGAFVHAPPASRPPTRRRRYSIAYLIMVHGSPAAALANLQSIVGELDDGSAVFLVHVDLSSAKLRERVAEWIQERDRAVTERIRSSGGTVDIDDDAAEPGGPIHSNVFLAQYSYRGLWGHISLVWMQLSGFWELLDLADWDYVINLSGHDFPLRRSREIARLLDLEHNRGMSSIGHWIDSKEIAARLFRPHVPDPTLPSVEFSMVDLTSTVGHRSPPQTSWRWCKQHQWMILTRDLVEFLREDKDALRWLAFAEHTWIPDESFFCAVAINSPNFRGRVNTTSRRFIRFDSGSMHPHSLDVKWVDHIGKQVNVGEEPPALFMRKVVQFVEAGGGAAGAPAPLPSGDGGAKGDPATPPSPPPAESYAVPSSGAVALVDWIREMHLQHHLVPEGYDAYVEGGAAWALPLGA
ncbi:hypothetical protein HK405_015209 [Cladochytrium tenue]|nr:hypothetical protein HK405_015209 [Cladochytrium tenue]